LKTSKNHYQNLIDYLKYKFLTSLKTYSPITLPEPNRIGHEELADLKYYKDKILKGLKISPKIKIDTKDSQLKKLYLLRTLGPYNKGYQAVMNLSNQFWDRFNFLQILFIAKFYNHYPLLISGFTKPLTKKNKHNNCHSIVTSNKHQVPYFFHAMDCFRISIAIAGLDKGCELGYVDYSNFYHSHQAKTKYEELGYNLIDCFYLHCAELQRYGYSPISNYLWTTPSMNSIAKVGDIIYSNPLDYSFANWETMAKNVKCHMLGIVLTKIIDDLHSYCWYSTVNMDIETIVDAVDVFMNYDPQVITGNLSHNQTQKIIADVKKDIRFLLAIPKSIKQLENISKFIQGEIIEHNKQTRIIRQLLTIKDAKGRSIDAKRSKFHVNIVVDVNIDKVYVIQIDGANPLLPMSIVNYNTISTEQDKIVIFRKN
jgi:hypothetical protein